MSLRRASGPWLWNIMFIAYHANPIGAHIIHYATYHRFFLQYLWPQLYSCMKSMISKCTGYRLVHLAHRPSSEIVYHFPVEAPFLVMHIDIYVVGRHQSFQCCHYDLIISDQMTEISIAVSLHEANGSSIATTFM